MNIPILPGIITDVSVNDPFSGDINDEETDSVVDFRLGIGAAFAAGRHVSFTVNYVHVFGSQSTFTPNQELIAAAAPVVINTVTGLQVGILESNIETLSAKNSIDPTRNEILFGVIFSL